MDSFVLALAAHGSGSGSTLYAGGLFSAAGGASAAHVARWNGSSWSALGSGTSDIVNALTVGGTGDLFAGVSNVGQMSAAHVARWNGSGWASLGTMNDPAFALCAHDDGGGEAIYAGGRFSLVGGIQATRVARWNGTSWSALGVGVDDEVRALISHDGGGVATLFAGGAMLHAGGHCATRVAGWSCPPEPPCEGDTDGNGVVGVSDLVAVILAWGSTNPAADINNDGTVNVSDLVSVIVHWGPCA
jgi:hypothetical protein